MAARIVSVFCLLVLLAVVLGRDYSKFIFEEEWSNNEEEKSVPMMNLVRSQSERHFEQVETTTTGIPAFSWNTCLRESRVLNLTRFDVIADPILIGQVVHVTIEGTLLESINQPLEADFLLEVKLKSGWYTVWCTPSPCTYPDICSKIPCPIEKGDFTIERNVTIPYFLPAATYLATINFQSRGVWSACLQLTATITGF